NEEILIMENAYSALDYLETNKNNLNVIPSLILLDLDMPGMSGYEFLQHFKNFAQELKDLCRIIVLTGSDIQADLDRVEADPYVSKLINKPLSKNQLIPML
ncbi:MAG: response regulator, partial [Pedobacter sp.]